MVDIVPSGFVVDRLPERRARIVERWHVEFGRDSDTAPNTHDGLLIDILGKLAQAVSEASSLADQQAHFTTATGLGLDALIGGLFGSLRGQDTGSKGEVVVYGDVGTFIINQSQIATRETGVIYQINNAVSITFGDISVFVFGPANIDSTTIITIGLEVYAPILFGNGSGVDVANNQRSAMPASDPQIKVLHPVFEDAAGNGVLVVELQSILSSTVTSTASVSNEFRGAKVQATSIDPGDQPGGALTIVQILTGGQVGWEGVVNLDGVTPGFLTDEDAQYRQRHIDTLFRVGSRTLGALISILRDVTRNPGVEYVEIYNNVEAVVVDGRPPHSYEVVIQGGEDLTIVSLISIIGPEGIKPFGALTFLVDDIRRSGLATIQFTRPTQRHVWVDVVITEGEGFPSQDVTDLQNQVQNALFEFGRALGVGRDIYIDEMKQFINIRGVKTVVIEIGTQPTATAIKPSLSNANISILEIELSVWDVGKIDVVISA